MSEIHKRNLVGDVELSIDKLEAVPLSLCLLHKTRYLTLINLYLSSLTDPGYETFKMTHIELKLIIRNSPKSVYY